VSIFAPTAAATTHAHHGLVPHWLVNLGPVGLFAVSVLDSSPIPLPIPGSTDLLLLWLVSHSGNPWLLALCAIAGSLLGGTICWHIGQKGGEIALRKYVSPRLHARIVTWVQKRPLLAVFLPAVLPPPIPLSPFVLAAGALGVSRGRFMAAFAAARTLRYGLIAWLAVRYGRSVVRMWSNELQEWSTPLLIGFFTFLAVSVGFGVWKLRSSRKGERAGSPAVESARGD
jgi:membrane protein YqaA with SNARE-associated domain